MVQGMFRSRSLRLTYRVALLIHCNQVSVDWGLLPSTLRSSAYSQTVTLRNRDTDHVQLAQP